MASSADQGALLQERVDCGQNASIVVGLLEPDGSTKVIAVDAPEGSAFEIGSPSCCPRT